MDLSSYLQLLRTGNQTESTNPELSLNYLIQAQKALDNNKFLPINIDFHQKLLEQRISYLKKISIKISTKEEMNPIKNPTKNTNVFIRNAHQNLKIEPSLEYGWILMQWDERSGPQRLSAYPPNTKVGFKDFMQIYSNHIVDNERGMQSMEVNDRSFTSYYSGPEKNLFIILAGPAGQDSDRFEKAMEKTMNIIENSLNDYHFPENEAKRYYNQIISQNI